MILKNLNKIFNDEKDSHACNKKGQSEGKKREREAKRKEMQKGLNNFQLQMRNSILWVAFSGKIEGKMKFLHIRKFTMFLKKEIDEC